jgi:hypothetical protein
MPSQEYRQIFENALREFGLLSRERDRIDAELLKLRLFIYATVNLLSETDRSFYEAELAKLVSHAGNLTDSVRDTLKFATQRDSYFTATEVRDHLNKSGFDFSQYSSNPLASVNTVLRRFKPDEVESSTRDGVTAYRCVTRFPGHDDDQVSRRARRRED